MFKYKPKYSITNMNSGIFTVHSDPTILAFTLATTKHQYKIYFSACQQTVLKPFILSLKTKKNSNTEAKSRNGLWLNKLKDYINIMKQFALDMYAG